MFDDATMDQLGYYIENARGIAWDECHKIYILMDDEQMRLMQEYGYDPLIWSDHQTPEQMLATVVGWYEESCGLKFINAVDTNREDPNAGFTTIVEQGYVNPDDVFTCTDCWTEYPSEEEFSLGQCLSCYEQEQSEADEMRGLNDEDDEE